MNKITEIVLSEPVRTAAVGLIVAVVVVIEACGVTLDPTQKAAFAGLGLAALALAEAVRNAVTPVVGLDDDYLDDYDELEDYGV